MENRQDLIEAAEVLDFPTEGRFAGMLWELCSSHSRLPIDTAAQLYRDCGYIPFCGYPLKRSGKVRRMSRQERARAWATNPILKEYVP